MSRRREFIGINQIEPNYMAMQKVNSLAGVAENMAARLREDRYVDLKDVAAVLEDLALVGDFAWEELERERERIAIGQELARLEEANGETPTWQPPEPKKPRRNKRKNQKPKLPNVKSIPIHQDELLNRVILQDEEGEDNDSRV